MQEEYFTISDLNKYIKDVINAGFPQTIWVCGEIQQYDRNKTKKHIFFELVEKDEELKDIVARIGLVIFANRKSTIYNILKKSGDAFSLKDDIEVKFECKVDFYPPHGAVRLVVENIDPYYTLGKIAQEKQKLIALLKEKGILYKNKQLELPLVPLKIGLVTAYDSAAYNDFLSELTKSGFAFTIYLHNALMQGKKAEKDVCKALKALNKIKDLDVIIITRGGGSIADLSCFDSKLIAEEIAVLKYPVLSGIGHEINITIADMAAHTYAKTPTAIAQFLVNQIEEFLNKLDNKINLIIDCVQNIISYEKQRIKNLAVNLQNDTSEYLKGHHEKVIRLSEVVKKRPLLYLRDCRKILYDKKDILKKSAFVRLTNDKVKIRNYNKIIDIANPINTMKRGFSITRSKEGKILKYINDINLNEDIYTEVSNGFIESIVKQKNKVK